MPKIKVKQVDTLSRKPVSYAFAAFMRHCQLKNLAPYSYLYYNKNIQYFLDSEPGIRYMDEINTEVIERYIGKMMDKGNKVTAINARLNWYDGSPFFFNKEGYENFITGMKAAAEEGHLPICLKHEEPEDLSKMMSPKLSEI